jgi:hypothetical protein
LVTPMVFFLIELLVSACELNMAGEQPCLFLLRKFQ